MYSVDIRSLCQQLQYFQRLQRAGILSVQRERQRIILVEIGNEIRNGNLGNIDVEEVRYNNRTGLWIEPKKRYSIVLR